MGWWSRAWQKTSSGVLNTLDSAASGIKKGAKAVWNDPVGTALGVAKDVVWDAPKAAVSGANKARKWTADKVGAGMGYAWHHRGETVEYAKYTFGSGENFGRSAAMLGQGILRGGASTVGIIGDAGRWVSLKAGNFGYDTFEAEIHSLSIDKKDKNGQPVLKNGKQVKEKIFLLKDKMGNILRDPKDKWTAKNYEEFAKIKSTPLKDPDGKTLTQKIKIVLDKTGKPAIDENGMVQMGWNPPKQGDMKDGLYYYKGISDGWADGVTVMKPRNNYERATLYGTQAITEVVAIIGVGIATGGTGAVAMTGARGTALGLKAGMQVIRAGEKVGKLNKLKGAMKVTFNTTKGHFADTASRVTAARNLSQVEALRAGHATTATMAASPTTLGSPTLAIMKNGATQGYKMMTPVTSRAARAEDLLKISREGSKIPMVGLRIPSLYGQSARMAARADRISNATGITARFNPLAYTDYTITPIQATIESGGALASFSIGMAMDIMEANARIAMIDGNLGILSKDLRVQIDRQRIVDASEIKNQDDLVQHLQDTYNIDLEAEAMKKQVEQMAQGAEGQMTNVMSELKELLIKSAVRKTLVENVCSQLQDMDPPIHLDPATILQDKTVRDAESLEVYLRENHDVRLDLNTLKAIEQEIKTKEHNKYNAPKAAEPTSSATPPAMGEAFAAIPHPDPNGYNVAGPAPETLGYSFSAHAGLTYQHHIGAPPQPTQHSFMRTDPDILARIAPSQSNDFFAQAAAKSTVFTLHAHTPAA